MSVQIQLTLVTDRHMGDHGELHRIALPTVEVEDHFTINEAIDAAREMYPSYRRPGGPLVLKAGDVIEVRTIEVSDV